MLAQPLEEKDSWILLQVVDEEMEMSRQEQESNRKSCPFL